MSDYSINATIGADDSDFSKVVENVITGLGDISKSFDSMSDSTKASFADIANQFQAIDGKAKVWGDSTDTISEKQKTLKDAINKLIDEGIAPESQQIKDLKDAYDTLGKSEDTTGEKSESLKDKFADLRDIMQGPVAACKLIVDGIKNVITKMGELSDEFAEDETAQLKFTAAIEASSVMTEGAAERLNTLAEALASSTGEANSAAQSQIAMLAATGRTEPEINKMITAAKGLAVATGVDLDTALNQINQTFSGTTGKLAKTTPALADLSTAELENGGAVDILIEKYGDMGDALDNSSEVSIKNNTNAWGEVKSAIGKLVEESMKPLRDNMTEIYNGFAKWATTGNNLKETLSTIALVIGTIAAAVGAYVIVTNAATIASVGYTAATKLAAIAQGVLNAVLDANPIGVVAAGMAVAAVLIIKNWDLVSDTFKTVFAYVAYEVEVVASKLSSVFIIAFNTIKTAMLSFAQVYIDTVLGSISNLLNVASKIPGVGDNFKAAAKGVDGFKESIDKSIQASKDDSAQAIETAKQATTSAKDRLDKALKAIADEKAKRKDANDADIEGQDDSADNNNKAEDKKTAKKASTVKYEEIQNAKALQSYIDSLDKEESAAIANAKKKELSAADVVSIAKDYDDKELDAYTAMIESQRTVALAEAAAKKADAESIANINQQYNDKITTYEQTQLTAREKLNTDYSSALEKKAEERQAFELKWSKQSTTDKQTQLDLQYAADVAKAKNLITNETELSQTLLDIDKKYSKDSMQVASDKVTTILGYSKSIVSSIGGDGATLLSSFITTASDITKAVASDFTDIQSDIAAIGDIIGLAGKADSDKYTELQNKLSDVASELLDAIEPVLSLVLDLLIDMMPILESIIPIIKTIFDILEPFLPILRALVQISLEPLILEFKAINFVIENLKNLLTPVTDEFAKFGEWARETGSNILNGFAEGIKDIGEDLWDSVKSVFIDFFNSVWKFFGLDVATNVLGKIGKKLINGFIDGINVIGNALWSKAGSPFIDFINSVNNFLGIDEKASVFYKIGENIIQGFINGIVDLGGKIWDGARSIFTGFWDSVADFFGVASPSKKFAEMGGNLMQGMINGINATSIWDSVSGVFTGLWANIKNVFSGAYDFGSAIVSGITSGVNAASTAVSAVTDTIGDIASSVGDTLSDVVTAVAETTSNIGSSIAETVGDAVSAVAGTVSDIISAASDTAGNVGTTVADVASDVVDSVSDFIDSIKFWADGTDFHPGGYAVVGEQGPELVNLPRGTSVTPAGKTADILSGGNSSQLFNYTINSPKALNEQEIIAELKQYDRELAFSGVAG